ncbi:MAG TPA: hypothetical protein VH637_24470 [Streptosporangiaceae bacterium]|jgi:hypothetical protein
MGAFQQLTRGDKIVGVAGIVLFIGMIAFPWYHIGVPAITVEGHTISGGASYDANVMKGPGSFFSIVAFIVLIALLAEFAVRRFTSVQLPSLPISWGAAELYAALAVLVLLVIKILFHIGNFGWGFYADLLLAVVLAYGAVTMGRGPAVSQVPAAGPRHSSVQ